MTIRNREIAAVRWQKLGGLGLIAAFALLLAFAGSPTDALGANEGDAARPELASPVFHPTAVNPEAVGSGEACGVIATGEVAGGTMEECHSYSKKVDGECCATMEDKVCCGDWCHDQQT